MASSTAPSTASAATPQDAPKKPAPLRDDQIPWPIALGFRTAALERTSRTIDEVVLVPDGRTYLEEIGGWSKDRRWPVLIEDDFYTPTFIRAFRPARVVRRPSAGAMPEARAEREALISRTAAEAIADGSVDVIAACGVRGVPPSMVVVADAMDGAWTAALALSAGRLAPIHFTDGRFGRPGDQIDAATFGGLATELERAAERTGLPWRGLGDAIDAFVVCADVAWKCVPDLAPGARIEIPNGPFPTKPGQPVATFNALGRHADAVPWAIGGGIFGSEARCAYVAMCSLFAPRTSAWLFNTYDGGPGWDDFDVRPAATEFEKQGLAVQAWTKDKCDLDAWRRVLMGGFGCDVLVVNSHGMSTQFGTAMGGTASVGDVPFFDRPCAVHFLHSFSLQYPADPATIGGAFLEHGAYLYYGSVYEPLLQSFIPPKLLAERLGAVVPFGAAVRQFEGMFARPWRTALYGDPLALIVTPTTLGLSRVAPADAGPDGPVPVRDGAAAALRRYRDEKDPSALVEALADLEAIGDDELVLRAWQIAQSTDAAPEAAGHALGALYRARDFDGFTRAFAEAKRPAPFAREMLWQLAVPRLGSLSDARVAALLGKNTRGSDPSVDLRTLRDAAFRLLGRDGWRALCDLARASTEDDAVRKRIDALR